MNFLETIKIVDGRFLNLDRHLDRMRKCCDDMFGESLSFVIDNTEIPFDMRTGTVKCRIVYNRSVLDVSYSSYSPRRIDSLRVVHCNDIDYHYKYADRWCLERLLELKDGCDDILIIKNGFVTDTSYSNVAFSDGDNLFIPKTYLLNGCKRRFLIENDMAREIAITYGDIKSFSTIHLINAMLEPGEVVLKTENIV